jgi:hypothetical protein
LSKRAENPKKDDEKGDDGNSHLSSPSTTNLPPHNENNSNPSDADTTNPSTEPPSSNKQPGKRQNYSKGSPNLRMKNALDHIRANPSDTYEYVASKFDVDRKSLRKRAEGELTLSSHQGRIGFLPQAEEKRLAQHCIEMAQLGYGYDVIQIRNIVRYYLKNKKVTSGWWQNFTERNPEITRRRGEALERQRMNSLSSETFTSFFELLNLAMIKCKEMSNGVPLTSARIFNMDEVGFDLNSITGYVVTRRGTKNVP